MYLFDRANVLLPDGSVLKDGYVSVDGLKISYVGSDRPEGEYTVIDGSNKVLMPALTNAHTHLPMSLLRGYADGRTLQDWLFNYIMPAEEKLTDEAAEIGARLSLLECIASGTVRVYDMYDHCLAIAEAVSDSGMSAALSRGVTKFNPKGYDESLELIRAFHNHDDGRIKVDACIHAEYTSDKELREKIAELADEYGIGCHVHLSETKSEHDECRGRNNLTPAAVLERDGLWRNGGIAAHCVWLEDGDMDILARNGVTAVHCPVSNLKLRSGIADISQMRKRGVSVALATDGVASNNSHDLFEEMKLAAMLVPDPGEFTAFDIIKMACNGSSVESGAYADLVLLDFDKPHLTPCTDIASHVVYAARGSDVVLTMSRGRILYKNGEFLTLDKEKIIFEAKNISLSLFGT